MKFGEKLKSITAASQKIKNISSGLQTQLKDSQTANEFAQKILVAAKHGLIQAGLKSAEAIRDEAAFTSAEYAHSYLPRPYRIILPKKIFIRLMYILREKLIAKGNGVRI